MLLLSGCATSLTNMTPAKTMDPGEGQAATGYQFDLHSQSFTSLYNTGESVVNEFGDSSDDEMISEETLRRLLDTALLWRLFPFGGGPEFMARVGIYEGIDIGFRYNGNVAKGDIRFQLWESSDEASAVSAQFGYGRHSSIFNKVFEWLDIAEWSRHDFDFQINYGYEIDDWAKFYISPRYIYSHISTELGIAERYRDRIPERFREMDPGNYISAEGLHYAGLNWGVMMGYKYVFVNLDVSTFRVLFSPTVLGSERDYNGWVVSPTLGLTVMW